MYTAPEAPSVDDVVSVVRANLVAWVRGVRERRGPSESELGAFSAAARVRARSGHPLADLLHAYRIGATVAWEALAATTSQPTHLDAALAITGSILRYIDEVSTAVAQAHIDERNLLELDGVERSRTIIESLLAGATPPGCAERHRVILAVAAPDRSMATFRHLNRTVRGAPGEPPVPVSLDGKDIIVLIPVPGRITPESVASSLRDEFGPALLAVSPAVEARDIAAARAEVRQVAAACRGTGRTGMVQLEDVVMTAVVQGWGGRTQSLLRARVGPLRDHDASHRASLIETVRTLAEVGTAAGTAAKLHLHRNSVAWRLDRVRELTGLDPTAPRDLLLLLAAIEA